MQKINFTIHFFLKILQRNNKTGAKMNFPGKKGSAGFNIFQLPTIEKTNDPFLRKTPN